VTTQQPKTAILRQAVDGRVIVAQKKKKPYPPWAPASPASGRRSRLSPSRDPDGRGRRYGRAPSGGRATAWTRGVRTSGSAGNVPDRGRALLKHARRRRPGLGGPKWTGEPRCTRGCQGEMEGVRPNRTVRYEPRIIDASTRCCWRRAGTPPLVIPALNRDGDNRSDLVMQMFGTCRRQSVPWPPTRRANRGAMSEAPARTRPRAGGERTCEPDGRDPAVAGVATTCPRRPTARVAGQSTRRPRAKAVRTASRPATRRHAGTEEFTRPAGEVV